VRGAVDVRSQSSKDVVRLLITKNQTTSPKVHESVVCNLNNGRSVLEILIEREIMTPRTPRDRAIWRDGRV
jgi:hypothetical protein